MKAALCVFVALALVACAHAASLTMASMCRDQNPHQFGPCAQKSAASTCRIDFEWGNNGLEKGIVTNSLDVNTRKPQYCCGTAQSPKNTVHNKASFDTWFNDSPFTKNIPHNLTLTNTASNPRIYGYDDQSYFPFDGKGWDVPAGTDQYLALDNRNHNFHFCSEAHGRFAYKGGETFTFLGDDDVFVYINNKLALDLGGVHGPESGTFNLDDIARSFGLVLGNNYRFDFFWCERHTLGSDIKLTTSLEIFCSYYDWCDICDGNGQSCCPAGACDDSNKCTTDLCAVLVPPQVDCQHIPVNCTAQDICNTAACSRDTGLCVQTPITCADDGNKCTIESCDASRGGCLHTQKICDDGKGLCTQKTCDTTSGTCTFPPTNCDDNNMCTADSCDYVKGCQHQTILCNDNDPCTIDTCDSARGCIYTPMTCNDNSVCTTDSCKNGQCQFLPINCDDGNMCTTDSCDAVKGCQRATVTCNDNDMCTSDACVPASGCQYTPISCDDGDACTTDSCGRFQGCLHDDVVCNDGNICTYDTCDSQKGCLYPQKKCDDNAACTTDSCGPSQVVGAPNACLHSFISCDDADPCTIDSCSNTTGCVHQPVTCAPNSDPCKRTTCVKGTGCVTTTLPATTCNACYDSSGAPRVNCPVDNKCRPSVCSLDGNNAVCIYPANVTCNDNNACTTDTCMPDSGQCKFTANPCNSTDLCIIAKCDTTTGVCSKTPVNCDDGNACTKDSCSNGVCSNVQIDAGCVPCGKGSCNTTDYCNPNVCVDNAGNGQCQFQPLNCNDGNKCTDDSCVVNGAWNATCDYKPHDCLAEVGAANVDGCHPITCDSALGCLFQNVTCDDGNACTIDKCTAEGEVGTCSNDARCPTTDACNPNVCDATDLTCSTHAVNCDDGDKCTVDSCAVDENGLAYCINDPIVCNYTDYCNPQTCELGVCVIKAVNCDDGVKCTIDSCNKNNGTCNHILNPCNDGKNCTLDQCFNNANNTDGCVNEPIICPGNPCNTASCDEELGCILAPIYCQNNDTDFCTAKTCDESIGCLNVTRTCLLKDLTTDPSNWKDDYPNLWKVNVQQQKYKDYDCFSTRCDAVISKCVVVQRDPFGVDCQVAYYDQTKKAVILTAGAIAGVAVAAVVFAALAGFGAKKGYDAWVRMKDERFGAANTNPMYAPSAGSGTNALYA